MTADRRAALVEMVADLVRFNHDPVAIANEAIALIRAEVLEEAARVAGPSPDDGGSNDYRRGREHAQAAIRALKET